MKRDWNPEEIEMMDRPQPVSPELERDLENLGGLNRYFGSHAVVRQFIRQWWKPGGSYRVLDLCTGYGDIPRMMLDWGRSRNVKLAIDAVDFHPATLEIARLKSTEYPEIRYLQGDARSFVPDEAGYDLVHCSLALHHFSEQDATCLLRRCRDFSNRRVLVVDLDRNRLTQAAVWLVTATIYRDPMTQYDARLSARRAFSFGEFRRLANDAGWNQFSQKRFFPCRQAVWI